MRCADCKQKPWNCCQHEGFDYTGGKLDLSDYQLEKNRISRTLAIFCVASIAPVTVLVVKDRLLANNPMGVVYGSYWRSRFKI
ncbi:MAG: hypothetical protein ABFS18_10890 [Thermodesulfobacteriota bacterium]